MFNEILLLIIAITPYVLISMFFIRFRCLIKKMSDIENVLNDTPKKESTKRDELKGLINNGHADKLPGNAWFSLGAERAKRARIRGLAPLAPSVNTIIKI